MKMPIYERLLAGLMATALLLSPLIDAPGALAAEEDEKDYYVCFSDQNFAVRSSNRMEKEGDVWILSDRTLSASVEFYVTDNAGLRYYGADNQYLTPEEPGSYSYDILFSPGRIFDSDGEEAARTDCHVSYRFHVPSHYTIEIDGQSYDLTYNPYFTDYELYYASLVWVDSGKTVRCGEETHLVLNSGYYRFLFTPGERRDGKDFAFDKDGNYGSGDSYCYHLCLFDTLRYFVVFEDVNLPESGVMIEGKSAALLSRFEDNVHGEEYRSERFFLPENDNSLRYTIYEEGLNGSYRAVDDDNDEDTKLSRLTVDDAGWYQLSFSMVADGFVTTAVHSAVRMGGFYVTGAFNRYGFDGEGSVDISGKYRFTEIEKDDPDYGDDYNEDYRQYILYLTLSEFELEEGDLEFIITDGDDRYKNGDQPITLNTAGRYKILFSDEHDYGGGRHYRYTLEGDGIDDREIEIYTVEDYLKFAEDCNRSADYSVGLTVWLSADLDFEGVDFLPIVSFSGKFYGSTHTLANIRLESEKDGVGIFERVNRTGSVERLNVAGLTILAEDSETVGVVAENYGLLKKITVDGEIRGRRRVGGVVGYNSQSEIDGESSTVDSVDRIQRGSVVGCLNRALIRGESSVGGIAGQNTGDLSGSVNEGEVLPTAGKSGRLLSEIGGIVGASSGRISDCRNAGRVGGDAEGENIGGICGLCTGAIDFCTNEGEIFGSRYVGGAVGAFGNVSEEGSGRPNGPSIDDYFPDSGEDAENPIGDGTVIALVYTVHRGRVRAGSYAGGICGIARAEGLTLKNCASVGDVRTTVGSYAGGICGRLDGSSVYGCIAGGSVEAHGSYAGGICGWGGAVEGCMASADVSGSDFVGGIAGKSDSPLRNCYTNCLIRGGKDAACLGAIAGEADGYNSSMNSFEGKVAYNYFVASEASVGGIRGVNYEKSFDFAAAPIESEKFAFAGMLSPHLDGNFSHDDWVGGADERHYPAPYHLTVEVADLGGLCDEKDAEHLFESHREDYAALISETTAVTYTITLWEWNKDKGDLYKDGELQLDNFEKTAAVRLPAGSRVEGIKPVLATAEGDRYRYESDEANYFVYLDLPERVSESLTVYARYREIVTTLADKEGSLLVEGEFVKGTTVERLTLGECTTLRFLLDGEELSVGTVRVKVRPTDRSLTEVVRWVDGSGFLPVKTEISGDCLLFEWTDGDYFAVRAGEARALPWWGWLAIGGGAVLVVDGLAWMIGRIVKARAKRRLRSAAEADASETRRQS